MFLKPSNRTRIIYGEKHSDMYLDHYHNGIPVHVIEIHLHVTWLTNSWLKNYVRFFLCVCCRLWNYCTTFSTFNTLVSLANRSLHIGSITPFSTRKLIWKIRNSGGIYDMLKCINLVTKTNTFSCANGMELDYGMFTQ